jgi:hypothetical protein
LNEVNPYPTPPDYEFLAFGLFWKFKKERCFKWTGDEWVRSLNQFTNFSKITKVYPPVAGEKKG